MTIAAPMYSWMPRRCSVAHRRREHEGEDDGDRHRQQQRPGVLEEQHDGDEEQAAAEPRQGRVRGTAAERAQGRADDGTAGGGMKMSGSGEAQVVRERSRCRHGFPAQRARPRRPGGARLVGAARLRRGARAARAGLRHRHDDGGRGRARRHLLQRHVGARNPGRLRRRAAPPRLCDPRRARRALRRQRRGAGQRRRRLPFRLDRRRPARRARPVHRRHDEPRRGGDAGDAGSGAAAAPSGPASASPPARR